MIKDIFNWSNLSKWRDEIYGFSIIWIIFHHIFQAIPKIRFSWTSTQALYHGDIGVDIFLFMSGICLYFSMKKNNDIVFFYKKRFSKILKVFIFFCIPYLIYRYLYFKNSPSTFWQQITFTTSTINSFWFLLCILICYLIYPFLFKLLEKKKGKYILWLIGIYVILLFFLANYYKSFFHQYQLLFARIPIFMGGGLCWC